jgi:circadian clock protein KaiC
LPITSFWVGEYNSLDTSDAPELAIADAIVSLSTDREGERNQRVLSVIKLRGSDSLSGKHAYRLSSAGIHVFPRMADPVELNRYSGTDERMSSGVPALDAMLSDGYYRGASTLVAGPSGVGKTLFALHFIFAERIGRDLSDLVVRARIFSPASDSNRRGIERPCHE